MTTVPAASRGDWKPAAGTAPAAGDWRERAACRDDLLDPDLWFEAKTRAEALHICRSHCTVRVDCAVFAQAVVPSDCVMGGQAWPAYGNHRSDRTVAQTAAGTCRICPPAPPKEPRRRPR